MTAAAAILDLALAYAQTARRQRQDDPTIADTLGWIYYKKDDSLKAVTLLSEATEKLPENPLVQYHFGMAQRKNGDVAGATRSLRASLKTEPELPGGRRGEEDAEGALKQAPPGLGNRPAASS